MGNIDRDHREKNHVNSWQKKERGGKIFQILINFCKQKCNFIKAEFVLNEIYFKFWGRVALFLQGFRCYKISKRSKLGGVRSIIDPESWQFACCFVSIDGVEQHGGGWDIVLGNGRRGEGWGLGGRGGHYLWVPKKEGRK